MKLLFDQNLSYKLCRQLADLFPDSTQARLLHMDTADEAVLWQHAREYGFVLVSQDADFADRAALLGPPPKVIWLRCGNQPTPVVEQRLRQHAQTIAAFAEDDAAACLEIT